MAMRIVIKGREVSRPAGKMLVGLLATLFVALFLMVVFWVLLPLLGVAATISVGLVLLAIMPASACWF